MVSSQKTTAVVKHSRDPSFSRGLCEERFRICHSTGEVALDVIRRMDRGRLIWVQSVERPALHLIFLADTVKSTLPCSQHAARVAPPSSCQLAAASPGPVGSRQIQISVGASFESRCLLFGTEAHDRQLPPENRHIGRPESARLEVSKAGTCCKRTTILVLCSTAFYKFESISALVSCSVSGSAGGAR